MNSTSRCMYNSSDNGQFILQMRKQDCQLPIKTNWDDQLRQNG